MSPNIDKKQAVNAYQQQQKNDLTPPWNREKEYEILVNRIVTLKKKLAHIREQNQQLMDLLSEISG